MDNPYSRGSEWRKWDLQVQTILDDNYVSLDQYYEEIKKTNTLDWQKYIAAVGGEDKALLYDSKAHFSDIAIDKKTRCLDYVRNLFAFLDVFNPDLHCIGVTDHNYFDEQLIDTFIDYSRKARCKIIPGVEINCGGVHMLLFFPDNKKLYEKDTFSAGIQTLLAKFNITVPKNASGSLKTTSKDPKEIIDEIRNNGGIVVYPHCNSDNGLFQERTKTDRTHLADIFNHQEMNLLQSQAYQSCLEVTDYIKSNTNLLAKCCHHISSDSRCLKDIGKCDKEGNYLWIKADPTFEGLKQIVYEPMQRIHVGSEKPEQKKTYFIIDNVRFLDNSGNQNFSSDPILVNQNLTTIIGGKSTGKSLLLHYIAKTIDSNEVECRKTENSSAIEYDFDKGGDFDFEVTWKDGYRNILKATDGERTDISQERKILYIPQKYLNTLSESGIKNREALNEFVMNVILQDLQTREKYDTTFRQIRSLSKLIPAKINELFLEKDDIVKIEEEIKQIGDERGITSYVEELQKQARDIKAKSGLTPDEIKQYEELMTNQKDIDIEVAGLEEDSRTINNLEVEASAHLEEIKILIGESEGYLNNQDIKIRYQSEWKVTESFIPAINKASANVTSAINSKIEECKSKLIKVKADLAPLLAKVEMQTELETKTEAIKKEQQKLNEIGIKKKSVKIKKVSLQKKTESLIDAYKEIFEGFENVKNDFKVFESKFGDIALSILVGFKEAIFNASVVSEFLNKKDLKKILTETEWGDEFFYKYNQHKHLPNMATILKGLLDGSIRTIKNRTAKDALNKLLDNYYYIDFRIFYKKDSLEKMSPGKKGLVLLQLLVNLSNEEWPILLDQPEDDLDNRSIYDDLVEFLKKKKVERQIIIVTHNPNLVVGADAEETVVANQSGQEVGRENRKYRFEYVSGALENAFELSKKVEPAILYRKGIKQHVCEILEGGEEAFQKREQKYDLHRRL